MGQKNIIELNGKKYDALTGEFLGESHVKATTASRSIASQRGRVIDGFVKNKAVSHPTVITPQPLKAPKKAPQSHASNAKPSAIKHMDVRRTTAKVTQGHHKQERPKTLMRHVVKKPQVTMKPSLKTTNPSEIMAAPKGTVARPLEKKLSASNVNPFRLARARHVPKSHHIQRFEKVRQPVPHVAASHQQTPASLSTSAAAISRPAQYANATRSMRQDFRPVTPQTAVTSSVSPVTTSHAASSKAADIFEAALAHATSHEEKTPVHAKYRSSRQRRWVNVMAGIGAFLLIGGFIGYMNMTNIELRVASVRAGFQAQLPSYQPTGYALDGGIKSANGQVAMNFRSGDRIYTVTQEASDWNSSTLLDQTAAERGEPSQTIQAKGRTIYIYDDSNATWVNGGVRYQVNGNAPLNADELVSLATSM